MSQPSPVVPGSKRFRAPRRRPLGLLASAAVDATQIAALARIESFDLEPVRRRLIESGVMLPRWAAEAVFEFRRYLGIRAVYAEPVTMVSRDVDEVWHTCLLFTRLYQELCSQVFGQFLHHDPDLEPNPERWRTWSSFERAYRGLYGEPGPLWQIWRPMDPRARTASHLP